MTKQVSEFEIASVLEAASVALMIPGAWAKGAEARDAHSRALDYTSDPRACKFCASGAITAATAALGYDDEVRRQAFQRANSHVYTHEHAGIVGYNDSSNRAERVSKALWDVSQKVWSNV